MTTTPGAALRPLEDLNALPLPALYERLERTGLVRRALELARDEDLGPAGRDLTGELLFPDPAPVEARIVAREAGVLAGLACVPALVEVFGVDGGGGGEGGVGVGGLAFAPEAEDGERVEPGRVVGVLRGPGGAVVRLERTLLNLVSRLSGVATRTARFVAEARAGREGVEVLDTRKTMPGLRVLEKYAVRCGGGSSHRLGLHDAVLIKDNHLARIPLGELTERLRGVALAARAAEVQAPGEAPAGPRFVEVEVDTLDQLDRVLRVEAGLIDFVLLDNMGPAELRRAVEMRDAAGGGVGRGVGRGGAGVRLEASGGVRLETIREIAATGVERISAGSLTHGAVSLDFGLDV